MRIGIDLDGVVADFTKGWTTHYNQEFGKSINDDPQTYFTEEVMSKLEDAAKKEFSYGGNEETKEEI